MKSQASTVEAYLAALPEDRRRALAAVREVILRNLDPDYEEGIQYGMIGYYVPHRVFPAGYHTDPKRPLPFAALASQKAHMSLYLMGLYCGCAEGPVAEESESADVRWFREAWAGAGHRLDMGKSCVRFKRLEDVPLTVIGEAIRRLPPRTYIARYEEVLARSARPRLKARKS